MIRVGILGARGEVGQKYIALLQNHPWFQVTALSGSKPAESYENNVQWSQPDSIPQKIAKLPIYDNKEDIRANCDFVFSALPADIAKLVEPEYAKCMPVISNASAFRSDPLVPMIIPEINSHHTKIIQNQQKEYDREGFIATKPNCSIQSFMIPLYALIQAGYNPTHLTITTLQATSGAGRRGLGAVEIIDNTMPLPGEAEKNRTEPNKIFGAVGKTIESATYEIDAKCDRVPVTDGHKANVFVQLAHTPNLTEIIELWNNFPGLDLPSAPKNSLQYLSDTDRPQSRLDRDYANGMGITIGGLEKTSRGISFSAISHNTIRGAAGGAILMAELLVQQGYIKE